MNKEGIIKTCKLSSTEFQVSTINYFKFLVEVLEGTLSNFQHHPEMNNKVEKDIEDYKHIINELEEHVYNISQHTAEIELTLHRNSEFSLLDAIRKSEEE